jgi:hypothetical protein
MTAPKRTGATAPSRSGGFARGVQAPKNKSYEIESEIATEFVKPSDLAEEGPFNITDAYTRTGQFGDECAFEIQLVKDGTTAVMTLKDTPARRKLVHFIKANGSVGPYVLEPVGKAVRGNQPWGFVPLDADGNPIRRAVVSDESEQEDELAL